MNNIPLVSIIVPVYNIEKYISKCIKSVLSQTFKDWELILVDDGSTDNSGKICDEYALKDNRIKVIHKENEGVTATRDKGVKEAQGEFLFFIDGDDYITDNALELLINKQKENDADLVRGSICNINENRIITKENINPQNINNIETWIKYIIENSVAYIVNCIFKTKLYKESINIPNDVVVREDTLTSLQYGLKVQNICSIQEITYFYVQRNNSVMHSINKNPQKEYLGYIRYIEEIIKLYNSYLKINNKYISNILEKEIAIFIILVMIHTHKKMFKLHKKIVIEYYKKYYLLKPRNHIKIFKGSWKLYLYSIYITIRYCIF